MLSREEHALIKIQFLTFISGSMAGLFLQVFIFKLAGLRSVIIYNLHQFSAVFIVYLLSGYALRRFSSRTLIKGGLITAALTWALILIFRESSVYYISFIGTISGISGGLYWSGYNLSQYIMTHSARRNDYFSKNIGFMSVANTMGPLMGGTIILFGGYYLLFLVACLIYIYNFFIAHQLPRHSDIEFSLRDVFFHKRSKKWQLLLAQRAVLGLYDVAFPAVSAILLFVILKGEFELGIVRTVIGLIASTCSFYASHQLRRYKNSYILGSMLATLGLILFGLYQNIWGIIGLGLSMGVGFSFLSISISTSVLNAYDDHNKKWKRKFSLFIENEAALGLGRIASYVLILLFLYQVLM